MSIFLIHISSDQSSMCGRGGGGGDTHPFCRVSQALGEVGDLAESRGQRDTGRA